MGAQKRKTLPQSLGLKIQSQRLKIQSLGLKTQIGELEAHAAFRQTQKRIRAAHWQSSNPPFIHPSIVLQGKIYAPLAMVNRGLHSHLKFAKLIF